MAVAKEVAVFVFEVSHIGWVYILISRKLNRMVSSFRVYGVSAKSVNRNRWSLEDRMDPVWEVGDSLSAFG